MEEEIKKILKSYSFSFKDEYDLQDALEEIFITHNIEYEREKTLSKDSQIDFLLGNLGLEVKVKGSVDSVWKQTKKYLQYLDKILIVTSQSKHLQIAECDEPIEVYLVSISYL